MVDVVGWLVGCEGIDPERRCRVTTDDSNHCLIRDRAGAVLREFKLKYDPIPVRKGYKLIADDESLDIDLVLRRCDECTEHLAAENT